jgi:hypothetical protein
MMQMKQLVFFFIPLGIAACLTTLTHLIIHSTLSKADHPEFVIASYAIGMSLLALLERPALMIRHMSAAIIRDNASFRAVSGVTWVYILAIFLFGAVISYTPVGSLFFEYIFRANSELIPEIILAFRFLMWVSVFSSIRCLYHGIIISQFQTKWLTIGMVIRIVGMFALAQWFVENDSINGGYVGAIIFATGMAIEMLVCYLEGRRLVARFPEQLPATTITTRASAFQFFRPLLFSSFIVVTVPPVLNGVLGQTTNVELSIASFAVASTLFQLVMSFFTYIHQMVINYHSTSTALVRKFQWIVAWIPGLLLIGISWTPFGPWLLGEVLGFGGRLLPAIVEVLRAFTGLAFLLPWIDYGNGFLIIWKQTKGFLFTQSSNAIAAIVTLISLLVLVPSWNGTIGALALTMGSLAELGVVGYLLSLERGKLTHKNAIGKDGEPSHKVLG